MSCVEQLPLKYAYAWTQVPPNQLFPVKWTNYCNHCVGVVCTCSSIAIFVTFLCKIYTTPAEHTSVYLLKYTKED